MRSFVIASASLFLSLLPASAQPPVAVSETEIRSYLKENVTVVAVPVHSQVDHVVGGTLTLSWLNTEDRVLRTSQTEVRIESGRSQFEVPLPLPASSIWLRLRYALSPRTGDARAFAPQSGTVSIAQAANHVFELKATQAGAVHPGSTVIVHAQAVHPITRQPFEDLDWSGLLVLDRKPRRPARVERQGHGFVEFAFDLPPAPAEGHAVGAEVKISAKHGDYRQEISLGLNIPFEPSARIQTDKPIYQPGQTLHLRAIILDAQGRAASGAKVSLQVEDGEGQRAHTSELTASRFGIIQDDWTLPDTAPLGVYAIGLHSADEETTLALHSIRVSRYELPKFLVTVKPDRPAYLPGQTPAVAIAGSFVFGKPVPHGHVKVLRTSDLPWRETGSKPDGDIPPAAEGDADDAGVFVARLDLKEDLDALKSEPETRFRDLSFAVYYTDPASRRTEQRRFDIRITAQPIHIYVFQGLDAGPLPRRVYVTTSYADGNPAATTIELALAGTPYTARTNRFGVARLQLPATTAKTASMELTAKDVRGLTGKWVETFHPLDGFQNRLTSPRSLYQPGDSVDVAVETPPGGPATPSVLVQALAGGRVVASQVAGISANKGQVAFPYQPEFKGIVTFVAWTASNRSRDTSGYGIARAQKPVIFPEGADLHLTVESDRPVYKPGEQASLKVRVRTADGRPVEAALGLAVVDQAVLERAQTESEFGEHRWFDCVFCPSGDALEIGGIRLSSLMALEPAQSQNPELNLVAEALLAQASSYETRVTSEDITELPQFESIRSLRKWMEERFTQWYTEAFEFPKDEPSLIRILGSEWLSKRDPWNRPYLTEFGYEANYSTVTLRSTGPDRRPGTEDDFVAGEFRRSYFLPLHKILESIFPPRQDYPADEAGVRRLLSDNGLLLDTLRDPWGTAYRVQVQTYQRNRTVQIRSAGPDRTFQTSDDFVADSFHGRYFQKGEEKIRRVLRSNTTIPRTVEEFGRVLRDGGIDLAAYTDAWGQPFRLMSRTSAEFGDHVSMKTVQIYRGNPELRTSVTSITRKFVIFVLRSSGPDRKPDTPDDFDMVSFPILLEEESATPSKESPPSPEAHLRGGGEVAGMVLDPSGAGIPNAQVVLILQGGHAYFTRTDSSGAYSFPALPPGICSLHTSAQGFLGNVVEAVPVTAGKVTQADITLQVGSVSETVTVEAETPRLTTESASIALPLSAPGRAFTPRVRTYFPETLYWIPELTTDTQGLAGAQFPLADSITTWKVAAIASTLDGRQVETESALRVFQPFFLDFDPPTVLTQGDEVRMPLAVRNYLDRALAVDIALLPNDWSRTQSPAKLQLTIPPNTSDNQFFRIVAKASRRQAVQRIAAQGGQQGDAIERSTYVHPDGQSVSQVMGDLMAGRTAFLVAIPTTAISGATTGELRLYPNVLSILSESAAAILIMPHGCAEQTTSAGFANLVALLYARTAGLATPEFEAAALKNIRLAVDQLASFRTSDGGISYWGGGDGDASVTAYVLDFLLAVRPVLAPNQEQIEGLVRWLESTQSANGLWDNGPAGIPARDRRAVLITAHVARSLAAAKRAGIELKPTTLGGAYHHLARLTDSMDDPYPLAQFILAVLDSGDESLLGKAVERLAALARSENTALYWHFQTNSPFYGWGTAGRVETTSLVISALSAWRAVHPRATGLDATIRRGLLFLLRHRDSLGSWYSTQSTVRAMRAVADASQVLGPISKPGGSIDIRVNGRVVHTVTLPAEPKSTDPIIVDMSPFLTKSNNRVELTPLNGSGGTLLRMTSTHWIPWPKTRPRSSPELRLSVDFNKAETRIGRTIQCSVRAERVGFRGYGMMLAEIGLPPGAEVDRSSLEPLLEESASGVQRYEILPDRVVFYLWPEAGGSDFHFDLSARLSMRAKAAASRLYDYYNPDALTEVPPVTFTVW